MGAGALLPSPASCVTLSLSFSVIKGHDANACLIRLQWVIIQVMRLKHSSVHGTFCALDHFQQVLLLKVPRQISAHALASAYHIFGYKMLSLFP